MKLADYATLVFDCDGVVLDSNRIKSEAFHRAALPYGSEAADLLLAYHVANGGISRYAKFAHFLDHIVPGTRGPDLEALLASYADAVRAGLMECGVAEGLTAMRDAHPEQCWLIASGGDQAELREIFAVRGLDALFNGGIFGSPDTKDVILSREKARGTITAPALFLGDSTYDHRAAMGAGLDFVFVSGWSEVADWQGYVQKHGLASVTTVWDIAKTDGR